MPSLSSWGTPTFSSETQVAPALPPCLLWDLYSLESRQLCSLLLWDTNWACCLLSLLCTQACPSAALHTPLFGFLTLLDSYTCIYYPDRLMPPSPRQTVIRVGKAAGVSGRLTPLTNYPSNSAKPRPAAGSLHPAPPTY